jgi:hypothetical protein
VAGGFDAVHGHGGIASGADHGRCRRPNTS